MLSRSPRWSVVSARSADLRPRTRPFAAAALLVGLWFAFPGPTLAAPSQGVATPGWVTDHYGVDDGLPTNLVTGVAQAADGAIWIATFDGLARLDGADIKVFRRSEVPAFPGNRFVSMVADARGGLWALEELGGLVWLGAGPDRAWLRVQSKAAGRFLQLVAGTAWLAGANGLERLESGTATPWHPSTITGDITALSGGDGSTLWVACASRGLWRVPATGTPQAIHRSPGASGAAITALAADGSGGVWAGTDGGGLLQSRGAALHQRVAANWRSGARPIREILPNDDRTLLARSDEGWWVLGPAGWQAEPAMSTPRWNAHPRCNTLPAGSLRWRVGPQGVYLGRQLIATIPGSIRQILLDHQGNLWIATDRSGVLCVRPAQLTSLPLGNLADQVAASVAWSGSSELWVVNSTGQLLHSLDRGDHWTAEAPRTTAAALPSLLMTDAQEQWPQWTHFGLSATSVLVTENGALWVGTDSGVALWSPLGLLPVAFPWADSNKTNVLSMFVDNQGQFWAATPAGLAVGNAADLQAAAGLPGDARVAWRWLAERGGDALRGVHTMAQDRSGDLWVATAQQGLARIRGASQEILDTGQGLASNRLRGLWIQDPATLWVGTQDSGLCRVRLRQGLALAQARVGCLTRRDGLRDDAVHSITGDTRGRLWLSGNRGITVLELRSAHAVLDGDAAQLLPLLLGRRHGMVDAEANGFRSPALAMGPQGQLLWPTQAGLALANPRHFDTPKPPTVALAAVEIQGIPQLGRNEELEVPPGATLTIRWTANEFRWPDQVRFRYRLGLDQPWQIAEAQRWAHWDGLPPGNHVFEVQAGLGGQWSKPASLVVNRHPAFRETWAFAGLAVLAALALTGLAVAGWYRQQRLVRQRLEAAVAKRTAELSDSNRDLQAQRGELAKQAKQLQKQSLQLIDLDQQKSAVLSNVSHELRTPLMLLQAPLAQLQAAAKPSDLATLSVLQHSVSDLSRLVDQLLQAASLQFGGIHLRAVEQDLVGPVRQLAGQFAPTAAAAGLNWTADGPPGPWIVTFDADLLTTAISNLVVNAVKFTPRGGSVAISWRASEADKTVRIAVADTGPGIDPAEHQRIFDRFYQVHGGDTRPYGGVGIGLSLAKEIAELHGGSIGVDSSLGHGCEFWIELPWPAVEPAPIAPIARIAPSAIEAELPLPSTNLDSPARGGRKHVLIVEDHLEMLGFLASSLAEHFDVDTANDGHTALARIAGRRPDAVVADVMMPGMDGLSLCSHLRAAPDLRELPVILISAKGTPRDLAAGLSVAQDYLVKPFAIAELLGRIWLLVDPHRAASPACAAQVERSEQAPVLSTADCAFVARLTAVIDARLDDSKLTMADLAKTMAMSPRTLQREVARTCGQRPVDLLNSVRTQRARQWLEAGQFHTLAEVAAAVGVSPRHLRRLLTGRGPRSDAR